MELTLKDLDTSNEVSLLSVVRISDLAMRRIIAMAKQLSNFQRINSYDQIALMKGIFLRNLQCERKETNELAHYLLFLFYRMKKIFDITLSSKNEIYKYVLNWSIPFLFK